VWETAGHNQVVPPEGDVAVMTMDGPLNDALAGELGPKAALTRSQNAANARFAQRPKEWEMEGTAALTGRRQDARPPARAGAGAPRTAAQRTRCSVRRIPAGPSPAFGCPMTAPAGTVRAAAATASGRPPALPPVTPTQGSLTVPRAVPVSHPTGSQRGARPR